MGWVKGQSGNPAGPAPGTRRRFADDFLKDLHEVWQTHGKPALEALAQGDTKAKAVFVKAATAVLPKQLNIKHESEMSEEQEKRAIDALLEALAPPAPKPAVPTQKQNGSTH